jgi:uncharacterized protein YmfQ (DUF2313 family)
MALTAYGNILRQLLPEGPVWEVPERSELEGLLNGLGDVFAEAEARGVDLLEEFDPRTTTEMLPDWERVYGLPGTNPNPPTSTADRRAALHAKMLGYGDPTPQFFVDVAAAIGYAVVITMYKATHGPFVPGSPVGDPLTSTAAGWPFHWIVTTPSGAHNSTLVWMFESLKPDHTTVEFVFTS